MLGSERNDGRPEGDFGRPFASDTGFHEAGNFHNVRGQRAAAAAETLDAQGLPGADKMLPTGAAHRVVPGFGGGVVGFAGIGVENEGEVCDGRHAF